MSSIKVHILHCGSVRVDTSLPFKSKSWNPFSYLGIGRSAEHQIWLPVSAYLIEHPKGLVLIDTGWSNAVRNNDLGRQHLGFFHWLINKASLPEDCAIDEQLAKLGYQTADLDYVILSHLHSDHVSGLHLVKFAKNILVSDLELEDAQKMPYRYVTKMWEDIPLTTFSFDNINIGPKGKAYDLFQDNTILLVHTPGHTLSLIHI